MEREAKNVPFGRSWQLKSKQPLCAPHHQELVTVNILVRLLLLLLFWENHRTGVYPGHSASHQVAHFISA